VSAKDWLIGGQVPPGNVEQSLSAPHGSAGRRGYSHHAEATPLHTPKGRSAHWAELVHDTSTVQ
jgi:hypothetical protein